MSKGALVESTASASSATTLTPPCPLCQKRFLARRSLLRHIRNVHGRNDHIELVPAVKSGKEPERLRNRLGRFVRASDLNNQSSLSSPTSSSTISMSSKESATAPSLQSAVQKTGLAVHPSINMEAVSRKRLVNDTVLADQTSSWQFSNGNVAFSVEPKRQQLQQTHYFVTPSGLIQGTNATMQPLSNLQLNSTPILMHPSVATVPQMSGPSILGLSTIQSAPQRVYTVLPQAANQMVQGPIYVPHMLPAQGYSAVPTMNLAISSTQIPGMVQQQRLFG